MNRSRGDASLDSASRYDRYSAALLPAWLRIVIGLVVAGLAVGLWWAAGRPNPTGDLASALAWLLPLAAVVALMLVQADRPDQPS